MTLVACLGAGLAALGAISWTYQASERRSSCRWLWDHKDLTGAGTTLEVSPVLQIVAFQIPGWWRTALEILPRNRLAVGKSSAYG